MVDAVRTQSNGEHILHTAKIGEELSMNLVKFSAQLNNNHLMLLNVSTAIGLIAGNLQTLCETIENFGPKIVLDDDFLKPLVVGLRACFKKVKKALNEAIEAENAHGKRNRCCSCGRKPSG
ncbi:uncharacterized protein RAG0_06112 [Rhynchosporium agropyri]|uniref:Uncharacterized protein n=1 Tax=Rhynchosporium agropyri TaxID=914238 RepID=A0A1E1KGA1_9HELO|nr:uncharacterized protein RAG0_06112 [Rhynchosporium agropyri]